MTNGIIVTREAWEQSKDWRMLLRLQGWPSTNIRMSCSCLWVMEVKGRGSRRRQQG